MATDKITTSLSGGGVSGRPNSFTPSPPYQSGATVGNGVAIYSGLAFTSKYPTLTFKGLQAGDGIQLALSTDGNSIVITSNATAQTNPIYISNDLTIATTNSTVTFTLNNTGVTAGTYNSATLAVDSKGRVLSIASTNSGVTPGTYTLATVVVDATGRVTSANSGVKVDYGVTHVAMVGSNAITVAGSPVTDVGTFTVDLSDTGIVAGTYPAASIAVDAKGRVIGIQTGQVVSTLTVNSDDLTIFGSNVSGSGNHITASQAVQIGLANTLVTPGTYTKADVVVDAKGRIQSIQNGSNIGTVKSVGLAVGNGLQVVGSPITDIGTMTLNLVPTGIVAGTYTKITVDNLGRATGGSALANTDVLAALGYVPAPTVSPTFTGTPLGVTASAGDNTIKLATTAFVQREIATAVAAAVAQIRTALAANGIVI